MKTPMRVIAGLFIASVAHADNRYVVKDQGIFGATGRFVEFADRYGWQSYEIDFDFRFDAQAGELSRKATLDLAIHKNDGGEWSYRCRGSRGDLLSNINPIYGRGVSIVVQCRVDPRKLAKAIGLDSDMVGEPTLVFQVNIQDGKAEAGVQKGLYFLAAGQIEGSEMNQYATRTPDLSELSVLFSSQPQYSQNPPLLSAGPAFRPIGPKP